MNMSSLLNFWSTMSIYINSNWDINRQIDIEVTCVLSITHNWNYVEIQVELTKMAAGTVLCTCCILVEAKNSIYEYSIKIFFLNKGQIFHIRLKTITMLCLAQENIITWLKNMCTFGTYKIISNRYGLKNNNECLFEM